MLGYLCENTNFKPCRLMGIYENNGCDTQLVLGSSGDPIIADVVFLIIGLIAFIFLILFVKMYKDYEIRFEGQTPTRGVLVWRMHIIIHAFRVLLMTIYYCITVVDGSTMHFLMVLQYVLLNWAQALLIYIALLDLHMFSDSTISKVVGIVVSLVVGALSFLMYTNEFCIVLFGLAFPLGAALFHFLAMIPLAIARKKMILIVYGFLMLVTMVLVIVIEIFVNGPICTVSTGWFTGGPLAILLYGLYRAFSMMFYTNLKKDEHRDGIKPGAARIGAPGYEDMNKPALIEQDDYSYSYTYTDDSE